MGGYGTLRIAMNFPGVFSSIFAQAPCCLSPRNMSAEEIAAAQSLTDEQIAAAGFGEAAGAATLAAWAPDPTNPPHFFDDGLDAEGNPDPLLNARLHANSPLVMLPQYLEELRALEAIRLEVGDADFLLRDDVWMHEELVRFGIEHEWQLFEGDHGNRVASRFRSEVLPFFGTHLDKE
jgi:S-formylglutathione hydrolase FrmB